MEIRGLMGEGRRLGEIKVEHKLNGIGI